MKISFTDSETGHAKDLGDNKAKIENVPFDGQLNYGDVVELDKHKRPIKLVSRRYVFKDIVTYPQPYATVFDALHKVFAAKGWVTEGAMDGLAILAHDGEARPMDIVRKANLVGISVRSYRLAEDGGLRG